MSYWVTFDAKFQIERITLRVDIANLLNPGEIIVAVSTNVSIFTGNDLNPSAILSGFPGFFGKTIYQKVQEGVPGVIYEIVFTVDTDSGRVFFVNGRHAVLPNLGPAIPILVPYYFTTTPYPVEADESYLVVPALPLGQLIHATIDPYTSSATVFSGVLYEALITYNFEDEYSSSATVESGDLSTILISYTFEDGYESTPAIVSGNFKRIRIDYFNWPPDEYNTQATIISGILS